MPQFNPKGQYMLYAGGNRREVYLQDGCFYNIQHELLPTDLKWLDENGYAMNAELRNEVINQMTRQKYRRELDELNAKIEQESAKLREAQATELDKHYKQMTQSTSPAPKSDLKLTQVEKALYGVVDPPEPDPFAGVQEEERVGELALVGAVQDPFEGKAAASTSTRAPAKGTVKIRKRRDA